jgi:predicted nucleotidyltransferase
MSLAEHGDRSRVVRLDELVREKRSEIRRIAAANGATRVRVFGSVARGTVQSGSDLDLLIE